MRPETTTHSFGSCELRRIYGDKYCIIYVTDHSPEAMHELRNWLLAEDTDQLHILDLNDVSFAAITGAVTRHHHHTRLHTLDASAACLAAYLRGYAPIPRQTITIRADGEYTRPEYYAMHMAAHDLYFNTPRVSTWFMFRIPVYHRILILLQGTLRVSLPVTRFLRRDGDNALMWRVLRYLL